MRFPMAAMGLCGVLAAAPTGARAQSPSNPGAATSGAATARSAPRTPAPNMPQATAAPAAPARSGTGTGARAGTNAEPLPSAGPGETPVYSASAALPAPTDPAELQQEASKLVLPNDPLEPYLLTKQNGPFMVLAQTFRGPESERMALALCLELRRDYNLPAYILRTKDWPMRSNIRGVPPTAPSVTMKPLIKQPEAVRTHDEAAVLVGNEKTLAATEVLLRKVKKLHPKCLNDMPYLWGIRKGRGLSRAIRTTNPFVPAQHLYPKPPDTLVVRMNRGLRSIGNCPGHYSLQVAQFSGRTGYVFNTRGGGPLKDFINPKTSPLKTAHDDAERLADKLSKAPEFRRLGQPVFVYHDRTSSRVFVGAFNGPKDPAGAKTRDELLKCAWTLCDKKTHRNNALDTMIVPAPGLTDVDVIKAGLR